MCTTAAAQLSVLSALSQPGEGVRLWQWCHGIPCAQLQQGPALPVVCSILLDQADLVLGLRLPICILGIMGKYRFSVI